MLKLILGELQPDHGTIRLGTKLSVAYFDQMREQLNGEDTLVHTISQGSDFIDIGGTRKHVISYLEDFLFAPERARSPVRTLSGGERNRLLLARLFTRPANVLVLDEPTNDLDIETLELLEVLLQSYSGTLFLVSHDREFLDNIVTQVIAFEGDGVPKNTRRVRGLGAFKDKVLPNQRKDSATGRPRLPFRSVKWRSPVAKLGYEETRELEELPAKIGVLERTSRHKPSVARPMWRRDSQTQEPCINGCALEEELIQHLTRWEELEAKQARTQANKISSRARAILSLTRLSTSFRVALFEKEGT